ncbi:conserved hypothetical protein [Roseibium sp. TrichSKD4]|nr:conserved hypothetical protein [Roseibium sp. TrichSKD4]
MAFFVILSKFGRTRRALWYRYLGDICRHGFAAARRKEWEKHECS